MTLKSVLTKIRMPSESETKNNFGQIAEKHSHFFNLSIIN